MRLRPLASGVLVAALSITSIARAQTSPDDLARAHFQSASAYFEQGRYEDAAREFIESYRLSPRPALLENAARAYERALLFDDAIRTLEELLERHPDYQAVAVVREKIRNLERLRERVRSGASPEEASEPEPGPTQSDAERPAPAAGGGSISIPGVVTLSIGGALGIAAIITGAVAHSTYESLSAACTPEGLCPADRQGDIDTGNALAITSTVLTFTSIAALGVGVVLMIVDSGGGSSEHAGIELIPGPGEVGLGARVRF